MKNPSQQVRIEISILNYDTRFESEKIQRDFLHHNMAYKNYGFSLPLFVNTDKIL